MLDLNNMKLGRLPSPPDDRNLMLANYLTPALPPPPASVDWLAKVAFPSGAFGNLSLGDCTCAGVGHAIQGWTANTGTELTLPDQMILTLYERACGYRPNNPATDQGGNLLSVAKYVKKYGCGGHKIDAFVSADTTNLTEIRTGLWLMGGLYTGFNVPQSAMQQTEDATKAGAPIVWDVVADDGGIVGGHCVYVGAFDAEGFDLISWGYKVRATLSFWEKYFDEALPLLSPDWASAQPCPSGFNHTQLLADVAAL
jgi:hypothetical protein